jgi:Mor family transcriptional regulator
VPEAKRACSSYRLELSRRNREIYQLSLQGEKVSELAATYFLSEKSIYRILGEMKKR